MLIQCPECNLQVSDKARSCPHCGYPIKDEDASHTPKIKKKRMKLPNGFGQISERRDKPLRKPFRVMITVGHDPFGKPITKPLKPVSSFRTYNEAYAALVEYNRNPYDLADDITINELYEKWSEIHFKTLKSISAARVIECCWAYSSTIQKMHVKDVRARHIKDCILNGMAVSNGVTKKATRNIQAKLKSVFNMMFDYAVEYELCDKNYARSFRLPNEVVEGIETANHSHISFSDEEIKTLWEHVNDTPYVDMLLVQCYSGWRPQELGLIKLSDVDFDNGVYYGGMKTKAGIRRLVPIHSSVLELVRNRYNEALQMNSEYLFNLTDDFPRPNDRKITYERYRRRFEAIIRKLNLNPEHRAHDPRVFFITTAKKYKMDEYAIKYMVGHKIKDITERVYTKRDIDWFKEEMEKIKVCE